MQTFPIELKSAQIMTKMNIPSPKPNCTVAAVLTLLFWNCYTSPQPPLSPSFIYRVVMYKGKIVMQLSFRLEML